MRSRDAAGSVARFLRAAGLIPPPRDARIAGRCRESPPRLAPLDSSIQSPIRLAIVNATVGSALFTTASMAGTKIGTQSLRAWLVAAIPLAITLAAGLKVAARHGARLGMFDVSILGVEVMMIALVTTLRSGGSLLLREGAGCCLVLAGTVLASSCDGRAKKDAVAAPLLFPPGAGPAALVHAAVSSAPVYSPRAG
ncbi:MAG: hypothetical protein AAGC92_15055 [Pseudomonadota bacterium]